MKLNKISLALISVGLSMSLNVSAADTQVGTSAAAGSLYDIKVTESTGAVSMVVTADSSVDLQSRSTATGSYSTITTITPHSGTGTSTTTGRTGSSGAYIYSSTSSTAYANIDNTAVGERAFAGYGIQENPNWDGTNAGGIRYYGGASATAIGADALAVLGGTAVGNQAQATGRDSVAIGKEAKAYGYKSITIGEDSTSVGAFTTVVGNDAHATGDEAVALGADAVAEGDTSVALGADAEASGENSVALGAGSVADRDNNVSVGSEGAERTISNVAPGVYGTDAVNVNQLKAVERKISAGVSAAMAMTTPVIAAGKSNAVALGAASYNNTSAVALNLAHKFTDDVVATASVSKGFNSGRTSGGNNDDIGIKGSVSWSF
jgi:hypothetical protein